MVTSQEKNNEKKDQLMIQESLWVELSQLNWGGSPSGFEKWTFTGWSDEDEDSSSENGIYTSTMAISPGKRGLEWKRMGFRHQSERRTWICIRGAIVSKSTKDLDTEQINIWSTGMSMRFKLSVLGKKQERPSFGSMGRARHFKGNTTTNFILFC